MTVLCANCHTANRDRAMFCIGCAAKLPAFAATGPSALQSLDAASAGKKARAAQAPAEPVARQPTAAPALTQRGLLLAVLLLGATVLALAAWISFGPERAAAPGMASAAAPLTPLPATPVAAPAAVAVTPPPVQVPLESALSPGESTVPSIPSPPALSAPPAPAPQAPQAPQAPVIASAPPAAQPVAPASPPTRTASTRGAADPRTGCEHLFFVLAARCEAQHCEQAAYSRHPRCDAVREQRQRDIARRNPTGGF